LLASTRTPYSYPTSSEFLFRTFDPSIPFLGAAKPSVDDILHSGNHKIENTEAYIIHAHLDSNKHAMQSDIQIHSLMN
jgi:hypothetical protein